MLRRIGYPCVSLLTGRTTNHSCMLKSATPEKLRALVQRNLEDLERILQHNLEYDWLLFRIGSSVVPFGSHPINQIQWWKEFKIQLDRIGSFARANDIRLSFHPGQYTVLNSPDPQIVSRAIEELDYSDRFLEALGLDAAHKIVIHVGGTYGDKPAAMGRFIEACSGLTRSIHDRLVIENDERNYTPADTLAISAQTGLPVVFDNLHFEANPGTGERESLLQQVFATWREYDGLPKVHFSSQAPDGRKGNHAHHADPLEFETWLNLWTATGDYDLMVEAKGKDEALLVLKEKKR